MRWARRGDGISYGDSGAPDIDEMEEKGVSGLDIGGVGNKSNPSACGCEGLTINPDEDEVAENKGEDGKLGETTTGGESDRL